MMQAFSNYDSVQVAMDYDPIPAGGYVCKIMGVTQEISQKDASLSWLKVCIDIADGDYTGYYTEMYKAATGDTKTWKGYLNVFCPRDDGSEKDEWTKRNFKAFIVSVEESNPGYHWDWNEKGLKGKAVGMIFRDEEWEYNGKTGIKARPYRARSVEAIETGKYKVPDPKLLAGHSTANTFATIEDDNDELPF